MANSKFEIVSKNVQTSASYVKGDYKVDIQYLQDKDGNVDSISMTIYKQNGTYAGSVNANRSDQGELSYSLSSVAQSELVEVATLADEINESILVDVNSGDTKEVSSSDKEE